MGIPFCFDPYKAREVNVMLEATFAIGFYYMWLRYAAAVAGGAFNEILAGRLVTLRLFLPVLLAIHWLFLVVGWTKGFAAFFACGDIVAVLLIGWMIYLFVQLNVIVRRIAAENETSIAEVSVSRPTVEIAINDPAWMRWVSAGLLMECIWMCLYTIPPIIRFIISPFESTTNTTPFRSTAGRYVQPMVTLLLLLLDRGSASCIYLVDDNCAST